MRRSITGSLVVALSLSLGAARVFAADDSDAKPKFDFSGRAAGIDTIVRADQAAARSARFVAAAPDRAPQATNAKKSFWKTPWPYVIIGGAAVVAGVLIANGSNSAY